MTVQEPHWGDIWFSALTAGPAPSQQVQPPSVREAVTSLGDEAAALLCVVPDPDARFPRVRHGEMGLQEGWGFARRVHEIVASDQGAESPRAIVVVVDVPSQAYGYVEELVGLHQALAATVDALATARQAGHPVTALIVGKAISGAFLAIGLQANRIVLLDHPDVAVQVMSKASAARITRRSVDELDAAAAIAPAMAYDGASFARLGAVYEVVHVEQPVAPTADDLERVRTALSEATRDARLGGTDLSGRLRSPEAATARAASIAVRARVAAEWHA